MPGYWAWDDGRNDFLWVSGFWRVPPPGRSWVPGGWRQAAGGWQWNSGFWTNAEHKQLEYLPAPPASVENGPAIPQTSAEQIYVPGNWYYSNYHYVWRPGVWVGHRAGWVWIPAHYRWTAVGYVFVDGYWDYELRDRGILFSPVVIDVRYAYRPGWFYRPTYVVYSDSMYGAPFVRSGGYYYGDYFEPRTPRSATIAGSASASASATVTIRSSPTTASTIAMIRTGALASARCTRPAMPATCRGRRSPLCGIRRL